MPRKQTLSALLERRKRLDEEIESMRKEELAAVARWVLNKTGCVSMAELVAGGWVLSKRPPSDVQEGGDEEQKEPAEETEQPPSSVETGTSYSDWAGQIPTT